MSSNKKLNSGPIKRSPPNVFERLSKNPNNKSNGVPKSPLDHRPTKTNKSQLATTEKRKSYNITSNKKKVFEKRNVAAKTADASKKGANDEVEDSFGSKTDNEELRDSFHEKVLMESVPETIDKDLDDVIHGSEESSRDKFNINSSQICAKDNRLINSSQSENSKVEDESGFTPESSRLYNSSSITSDYVLNSTSSSVSYPAKSVGSTINRDNILRQDVLIDNFDPIRNLGDHSNNFDLEDNRVNDEVTSCLTSKKKEDLDDEKDVCDAESELDDNEFYKVKVQTRLVCYENSTLFIRNTSKQSLDSQNENESPSASLSSLNESLSSSSLQESLNCQETGDSTLCLQQTENAEQTKLGNVKNRLGNLMKRGKSILNDVYTNRSSYVPDVKNSINKIQGATRRSLQTISSSWKGGSVVDLDKFDTDSGFSSLSTSSYDPVIVPEEKSITKFLQTTDDVLPTDNEWTGHELGATNTIHATNDRGRGSEPEQESLTRNENTLQVADSSQDQSGQSDYSEFFLRCPCQKDENGLSASSCCSCQEESEFPLEIQELLDADYARMWWTITGNFGNILPIDWSKTYTRQKYLPVLNLNETKKLDGNMESVTPSPRDDDEDEVAHDLDLHQLILAGTQQEDSEPVKSAEEVIKEIDDIMQEVSSSEDEGIDATSSGSKDSCSSELQQLPPPLYHDKLKDLSINELNETLMELELVIRRYSETLISQLAHRDELEYEKELKNTFISLLLQVQNKRRNYNVEKKKIKKPLGPNGTDLKYLTTVIPYDVGHGPPDNETIHILIKILTAINEDSPTVPTLLTDYILRVLCPS